MHEIVKKTEKDCFWKVNLKLLLDNKNFWRTIKTYFSDKRNFSSKTMISKKDGIVFDNGRLSEIFNAHFINITKNLDLKPSTLLYLIIKEGRGGGQIAYRIWENELKEPPSF